MIKYGFNKSIICFLLLLRQMARAGLEQKYFRHNNSRPAAQNKKGLKGILNMLKYFHILAFNSNLVSDFLAFISILFYLFACKERYRWQFSKVLYILCGVVGPSGVQRP